MRRCRTGAIALSVAAALGLCACRTADRGASPDTAPMPEAAHAPGIRLQTEASGDQTPVNPGSISGVYSAVDAGRPIIDRDSE